MSVVLRAAFGVASLVRAGPTPSPTGSARGLGSSGHGTGFVVLAVILVAALVISGWRLRRDR
ncbi:MAG TPA: hypothetical protein VID47_00440 [Actinomycetota bacterium]